MLCLKIRYYHMRPRKALCLKRLYSKAIIHLAGYIYDMFHSALVNALHCELTLEFISKYMILWLWHVFLQAKGLWALIPHQEEHTMPFSLCFMICFSCITFKRAMWKYECYDVLYLCLLNDLLYMSHFYIL